MKHVKYYEQHCTEPWRESTPSSLHIQTDLEQNDRIPEKSFLTSLLKLNAPPLAYSFA